MMVKSKIHTVTLKTTKETLRNQDFSLFRIYTLHLLCGISHHDFV